MCWGGGRALGLCRAGRSRSRSQGGFVVSSKAEKKHQTSRLLVEEEEGRDSYISVGVQEWPVLS